MKELDNNSVDSIVTDPPAGIEFMGREWDSFKDRKRSKGWATQGKDGGDDFGGFGKKLRPAFCSQTNSDLLSFQDFICEVFTEAIRVLKPGGHALVWAIPRTSHHTAMGLERAGFEVRDCVYHIFGTGFPKSLNIGKTVDKLQGNEREVVGKNTSVQFIENGVKQKKEYGESDGMLGKYGHNVDVTKGTSPYEGWGTGLKPAVECWWLCRKPLSENTIAENVLKWGTGGINIDGCRVEAKPRKTGTKPTGDDATGSGNTLLGSSKNRQAEYDELNQGRFPANLIHDGSDEVVGMFPDVKSGKMKQHIEGGTFNVFSKQYPRDVETIGDSGSAARFFYCAKASKSERNKGLEGFENEKFTAGNYSQSPVCKTCGKTLNGTNDHSKCSGEVYYREMESKKTKNHHPTVKPVSLMQYLCRLITPKNGIVLDPFMGSGSTGIACKLEGFDFIGIEKELEYINIAEARINAWKQIAQIKLL
ncbi:MAG: site-specific DNA-methyltransferase [Candidatus Theseobacter exili]|nr:site-specific DNA-methyltransferase [Candidatus Theseobacter exili]